MSSKPSEHDEIIAEAREKYTVHNCSQCEFRKSCNIEFDSDECKDVRQSIMLGFGIEDGYFTKLLDRLEAAHKRESVTDCNGLNTNPAKNVNSEKVIYNTAKMREALVVVVDACDTVLKMKHDPAFVEKWATSVRSVATKALFAEGGCGMKVIDGKIVEATELELYEYYLTRGWDDVYSFPEYKVRCEMAGTKIIDRAKGGVG